MEIIEKLKSLDKLPMHMPGHKRNTELAPYLKRLSADLDITEIDGFDDLHCPEGILKKSAECAAELRNAKKAFYSVNGSTCGILAAICASVRRGDKVLCMRNCHKSVFNALEISGAKPIFISSECDGNYGFFKTLDTNRMTNAIENNTDARLVILTSPTYEGGVCDVAAICDAAHKYSIPVLVDAAHGAHLGYGYGFLPDALSCGADISVESLHKTLPSLTQTAVCYVSGAADGERIAEMLSVFETSSPSYLLLASIDGCINMIKNTPDAVFAKWRENLDWFYEKTKSLKNLKIFRNENGEFFAFDRSKIVILTSSGTVLAEKLRKRGIECEMQSARYVIAMTGAGDTRENFEKLSEVLFSLDADFEKCASAVDISLPESETVAVPEKAAETEKEYAALSDAAGRVCGEYIWAYPPGVPIIIPGEKITDGHVRVLEHYENCGIELKGRINRKKGKILVLKQDKT